MRASAHAGVMPARLHAAPSMVVDDGAIEAAKKRRAAQ